MNVTRMLFHFQLMPVEEIPPWGENPQTLSWFGLTLGWFWIEIGDQELFRYTQAVLEHWGDGTAPTLPYEDYQVVRYWEDLLEMLPAILDPIPEDLAALITASTWSQWQERALRWQEAQEDEAAWDTYYMATGWWGQCKWDAGHLAYPPRLWLWRVGDNIHLRWDNRGIQVEGKDVWEAQAGEAVLPVPQFVSQVEAFHRRFLAEMGERVEAIQKIWSRPEIQIDREHLAREQRERADWLESALNSWAREARRGFSWEQVREAMAAIERQLAD